MKKKINILNNADVKSTNKSLVLKEIKEAQPVSRQYIAGELGLSSPTISTVFDELRKCGIIRECGIQKSSGGRRSILYEICPKAGFVIAIELKNLSISLQIYNFLGEKTESFIHDYTESDDVINELNIFIDEVISKIKDTKKILGIGICLSGYISRRHGFVESKNLGIKRTKINEFIKNPYNLKYIVEDKIRSAACYDKWQHAVSENMGATLLVDINTGIGASIIINNEIYRGINDFAGEMGHVIVDEEKGKKSKGRISGYLEELSSEKAITEEVKYRIKNGESSCIIQKAEGSINRININMILDAVEEEDKLALDVMSKAINYIFITLINMIRLFDPEKIYIINSIGLKENLFKLVEGKKESALIEEIEERVVFVDDDEIFLKGAAAMILNDVYENVDKYFELEG